MGGMPGGDIKGDGTQSPQPSVIIAAESIHHGLFRPNGPPLADRTPRHYRGGPTASTK